MTNAELGMENITIDYSGYTPFKGARILYSYLEEGLECVKREKIKDVCIWQGMENTRQIVNFDFLKDLDFIDNFHWLVALSKKSDINGLYSLSKLKKFCWAPDNNFNIDFSKLNTIESMNLKYHEGLLNLKELANLKELYISSVKTSNLEFLPPFEKLELLRIINGKFISLEGLEHCENLKKLDLRRCCNLVYANATLLKLNQLESVVLDSKKHDMDIEKLKLRIPHIWVG